MKDWQIQIQNNQTLWNEIDRVNSKYQSYDFDMNGSPMALEYHKRTNGSKFTNQFSLEPRSEELKGILGDRFDFGKFLVEKILDDKSTYTQLIHRHKKRLEIYPKYENEINEIFEKLRLYKKEDFGSTNSSKRSLVARFFVDDSTYESKRYAEFCKKQRYESELLQQRIYKLASPYILLHLSAITPWKYHSKDFTYEFSDIMSCYERAIGKLGQMAFVEKERRKINDTLRYDILKRDEFRCRICGATAKDGVKLEVDHIIPVSKGGESKLDNLQTLCERCNRGKRDKM